MKPWFSIDCLLFVYIYSHHKNIIISHFFQIFIYIIILKDVFLDINQVKNRILYEFVCVLCYKVLNMHFLSINSTSFSNRSVGDWPVKVDLCHLSSP